MRDSSTGWDLGPDLDHFSSRTRQVLQYTNPNKINIDLLLELIDYIGTKYPHSFTVFARFLRHCYVSVKFLYFVLCQTNLPNLQRWMEPFLSSFQVWLTSSSFMICSPQTSASETKRGEAHKWIQHTLIQYIL